MSEIKEAPDVPGRWWVTRKDGYSTGYSVQRDADNELHGFSACYGDKWQNVDALEAERDAANEKLQRLQAEADRLHGELVIEIEKNNKAQRDIERLKGEPARLTIELDRVRQGWTKAAEDELQARRQLAAAVRERQTIHEAYNDAQAELASLSAAKGETDADAEGLRLLLDVSNYIRRHGRSNGEFFAFMTKAAVEHHYGKESSRAT